MILLTGATGYIGSYIWIELLKESYQVAGIDNLSNSSTSCLGAIAAISGQPPNFIEGDIRDKEFLDQIFDKYSFTHVIHLAGLKDIHESMVKQDEYFDVNVKGTNNLLQTMKSHNCLKIIFSSSAAVYGDCTSSSIIESSTLKPSNYYGETKLEGERMLAKEFNGSTTVSSISLRYFNVAGRHPSGKLPSYTTSNVHSLFSEIESVIAGKSESLKVFGNDWSTSDGTCIRDYLHITDLVKGHLDALKLLDGSEKHLSLNLGLGVGHSVYGVISSYERITGKLISRQVVPRRPGDVGVSIADTHLATQLIGWKPEKTLADICSDFLL
jgi:UDP-glucose 4-epimerase